jgi:flagellar protein FliL
MIKSFRSKAPGAPDEAAPAPAVRPTAARGRDRDGGWFAPVLLLTLVAAATGGLLSLHLMSVAELVADAHKTVPGNRPVALQYAGSARLFKLAPLITNLQSPPGALARIEASLVLDNVRQDDASVLAAKVGEDVIAYLRTVTVQQLEGARGLQYLREDLNERAVLRSAGKVREFVIETLVVQ